MFWWLRPFRWKPRIYCGGVVYVDVIGKGWRHRLQGMDHYWYKGRQFGMFNSTDQYEGRSAVCYLVTKNGPTDMGDVLPPNGAKVSDGIMLTDAMARHFGLL